MRLLYHCQKSDKLKDLVFCIVDTGIGMEHLEFTSMSSSLLEPTLTPKESLNRIAQVGMAENRRPALSQLMFGSHTSTGQWHSCLQKSQSLISSSSSSVEHTSTIHLLLHEYGTFAHLESIFGSSKSVPLLFQFAKSITVLQVGQFQSSLFSSPSSRRKSEPAHLDTGT